MSMYNLIEYGDDYLKTFGILWQYCGNELAVNDNGAINNFTKANTITDSFKFKIKEKMIGQTGNNDTKNVEMMLPLKYPSNFRRTLEMPLINCEITLDLNWSKNCIIVITDIATQATVFSITDTNLYVPVVAVSAQDNAKLLEQLKSGFKRTITWNKC